MASFVLLIVCLLLGVLVAHLGKPPAGLAKSLNWWVLHIALPATVLEIIPKLQFDAALWFLFVSMWLVFMVAWWLFHHLGTRLGWSRGTIGAVVLTAGLSNSSFVGFPLIEALRGKEALTYAAIADQLGSFLNASIGGSIVVALYSGNKIDAGVVLRKVLLFPPFIALLIALLMTFTPGWPALFDAVLSRLSATLAPLALFSVGLQLQLKMQAQYLTPFASCLAWKLGLAPLMIYAIGMSLHISAPIFSITLLQAAMAPMVTAAILAEQGELNPPLANMMVGLGILLSFITVPLWNLLV